MYCAFTVHVLNIHCAFTVHTPKYSVFCFCALKLNSRQIVNPPFILVVISLKIIYFYMQPELVGEEKAKLRPNWALLQEHVLTGYHTYRSREQSIVQSAGWEGGVDTIVFLKVDLSSDLLFHVRATHLLFQRSQNSPDNNCICFFFLQKNRATFFLQSLSRIYFLN